MAFLARRTTVVAINSALAIAELQGASAPFEAIASQLGLARVTRGLALPRNRYGVRRFVFLPSSLVQNDRNSSPVVSRFDRMDVACRHAHRSLLFSKLNRVSTGDILASYWKPPCTLYFQIFSRRYKLMILGERLLRWATLALFIATFSSAQPVSRLVYGAYLPSTSGVGEG